MTVIQMSLKIVLVKDGMFPETPLPNGGFVPFYPRFISRLFNSNLFQITIRKKVFYNPPSDGIIGIIRG
ncbi:MAG TPA: hypothetical protein DIW44_11420 [Anaerolineaceae bacterium]|nr:hypothetical protein [Anaerolineaceae bacterium]